MESTLTDKLDNARKELLDLSGRNRLLNLPRSTTRSSSSLDIVDQLADQVFSRLVHGRGPMSFLPNPDPEAAEPDETPLDDTLSQATIPTAPVAASPVPVPTSPTDDCLQTKLEADRLQKKLLKLFRDARTLQEEQGVNLLFLALGFLKWYEAESSNLPRYAPLVLVPVSLERTSAGAAFRIKWTEDDIAINLSLQAKLLDEFGLKLPELADVDDITPSLYAAAVADVISGKDRWEVLSNDIVLSFFSFSKFLMHRDLQPSNWPAQRPLEKHPLVVSLLGTGLTTDAPICTDEENIDRLLTPLDMVHVLDADSSQAVAIEEVKRGRSLVIQGPPGTGKSQTITNIIATAVRSNKTVLFVAEKMAALEVVKRRLDKVGLGDMCLELHSHKSNKRAVLDQLKRAMTLGTPAHANIVEQAQELSETRDKLNRHVELLHRPLEPAAITAYQALGQLVRLRTSRIPPANFVLANCLTWTADDFRAKRNTLNDFLLHARALANPSHHPWRGVQLESTPLYTDMHHLSTALASLLSRLRPLVDAADQLGQLFDVHAGVTAESAIPLANLALRFLTAPPMDRKAFASSVWNDRREEINCLLATGQTLKACKQQLAGVIHDRSWATDVSALKAELKASRRSLLRIFRRSYRQARTAMRSLLVRRVRGISKCLQILDLMTQGQDALHTLRDADWTQWIGSRAFGSLWGGPETAWDALHKIVAWDADCSADGTPPGFRQALARFSGDDSTRTLVDLLKSQLTPVLQDVQNLFSSLKFDIAKGFHVTDLAAVPLQDLKARLEQWSANGESLSTWIKYYVRWRRLHTDGLNDVAHHVDEGAPDVAQLPSQFEMAYYESLIREMYRRCPDLDDFDGVSHETTLAQFKRLDLQRIELACREVSLAHHRRLSASSGDAGEFGVIRAEIEKKRRHLPLRKLLSRAGNAVQFIKPVFMMSPSSIAQFLAPGALDFDLLLVDEASQVQPADALGAIARAKQVVVVGDNRQLPPTRFFQGVTDDSAEADDADDAAVGDLESVLGLCLAKNMPQRMLRWHYRSKHHSLITVSNHQFYDNKLFVVRSPTDAHEHLGLVFHHVPDGTFDRGKSRTNAIEARVVAEAIVQHAKQYPTTSLGVGTFSTAQRDAIMDELELRKRNDASIESFFSTDRLDPFFVKNLENIQGDERDVIFISVGYAKSGPDKELSMGFGPLSNQGGERRLNVLITRARARCEVFSSITDDDIDLKRANSKGAHALKVFLKYARCGEIDDTAPTGGDFESEFERQVAQAVMAHGFDVHCQIGVAGFFIDLAVVDPQAPGRYLLGIECDGATYHSARSARDRDRLRQMILEDRGWIIHRIWSTDWFHRPDEQLRKVLDSIEKAKVEWASRGTAPVGTTTEPPPHDTNDEPIAPAAIPRLPPVPTQTPGAVVTAVPYAEASLDAPRWPTIPSVPIAQLAQLATKVVEIEGPVHQDEVTRRLATLWGVQRVGSRISDAVHAALTLAERQGSVTRSGFFFSPPNPRECAVRNRANVQSGGLRKPEYLPPQEICGALFALAEIHLGISREQAVVEAARLFGFRSTSQQLRAVIEEQIRYLIETNALEDRNGNLLLLCRKSREVTRAA